MSIIRLGFEMDEIGADFFRRSPLICARELIGCSFRWHGCEGRIVETEAYTEFGDEACHTWNRPSARDFIRDHEAGTAYIYLNYGMHWLFNVLTKSAENSGFVLFRAMEPITGQDLMIRRRGMMPIHSLCSGPGKLSKAFGINGEAHGVIFLGQAKTGIRMGKSDSVVSGRRVGISRASDFPWRYGDRDSRCLSAKF